MKKDTGQVVPMVVAALLSLSIAVAGCSFIDWRSALSGASSSGLPGKFSSFQLSQGTFPVILACTGKVECVREYSVTVPDKIWGTKIEKLTEEGTVVRSGEVICHLGTRTIEENLNRVMNELTNTEIEMEEARIRNVVEEMTKRNDISKKDIQYEVNLFKLDYLMRGADTADVAISEIGVDKNESFIENFRSKMKMQKELLERGFTSSLEFEELELEYQRNLIELDQNRNKLEMYRKLPDPAEVKKFIAAAEKFRVDSELARREFDSFLKVNRLEEEKKKLDVKQKKHRVDRERAVIENAAVAAPIGGTLLYANTWMGKTRIGMDVWSGLGILRIVDLSRMKVIVKVNEKHIDGFVEGAKASVGLSAIPGRTFPGYVKSVSKLAVLRDANDPKGPKDFDVTIFFSDTLDVKLLPKMSADVTIICSTPGNVSKVPRDFAPGGKVDLVSPLEARIPLVPAKKKRSGDTGASIVAEDEDNYYVEGLPEGACIRIPFDTKGGDTVENSVGRT